MRAALVSACLLVSVLGAAACEDDPGGGGPGPADGAVRDAASPDAGPGDATPPPEADAAGPDAAPGPLTLTSPQLASADPPPEFPQKYTCAGDDVSLPLAWSGGPGAQSYAVVLEDTDNHNLHWIIWDLPAATRGLPEHVPTGQVLTEPVGAKQSRSYRAGWYGYLGPCPGGNDHTYVFTVYAVDTDELPGVTPTSNRTAIRDALADHAVASATLSGHSDASRP